MMDHLPSDGGDCKTLIELRHNVESVLRALLHFLIFFSSYVIIAFGLYIFLVYALKTMKMFSETAVIS